MTAEEELVAQIDAHIRQALMPWQASWEPAPFLFAWIPMWLLQIAAERGATELSVNEEEPGVAVFKVPPIKLVMLEGTATYKGAPLTNPSS